MDYKRIDKLLSEIKSAYESIGAEVELLVEEPAGIKAVEAVEKSIGRKLPVQLREFFLEYSKNCQLAAWLPDDFELPEELEEIFSATFSISLEEVVNAEESRLDWVRECFTDKEDEYDAVWHNKLGFMSVPNGDVIAFDTMENETNPPVVYLSHDDGEGHGYVLGRDFETYFEQLLLVGACGNEDWQMLPFCTDSQSGIVSDCKNAKEYRCIIGLNV